MNRKKYITVMLMLFLLGINKTYAACTQTEIDEFKRIESEYKVRYEIDKTNKKYILYFERSKPEMYEFVIHYDKLAECKDINTTLAKCSYFEPGEYSIFIEGQTETCTDILKEITLVLPKYNSYADHPLCNGIEEFVLCDPTYDKEIDDETFESRVETYKKSKEKEEQTEEDKQPIKQENEILTYIEDNLIQIIIISTFIILLTITIIVTLNSMRKSRRLE